MSGNNEHTPGPWKPEKSFTWGILKAAHNDKVDWKEQWTDADIQLIAAAPDLLAACEAFIAADNQCGASMAFAMAQEAVRKATNNEHD
jgi:hypothetical protein